MEKLVLFVKSYNGHLDHTVQLIDSIREYNVDNIKTYLSIPRAQSQLFKDRIDTDVCEILYDEDIVGKDLVDNWYAQQLVKMSFSGTELAENYLWIDADSYFIRPFAIPNFMHTEDIPYTNITECRDLLTFCATRPAYKHVFESYARDRVTVMNVFDRTGKLFDSVCPNLWSSKVLTHMVDNYLNPNELTFESLLQHIPGELIWYTEYLLATRVIPIIPCEGWFKAFHYVEQMEECRVLGNTEETLSINYLGIVMPSKQTRELRF